MVGQGIACTHVAFGFFGIMSHFMIEYSLLLTISSTYGDSFSLGYLIVLLMSLIEMKSVDYLVSLYLQCTALYNTFFNSSSSSA